MTCPDCGSLHILPEETRCPVCGEALGRGLVHIREPLGKVLSRLAEAYARQHDKEIA